MRLFRFFELSLVLVVSASIAEAQGANSVCTDFPCGGLDKVSLCHVPPGNSSNPQDICIASSAVTRHLAENSEDFCGPCDADPFGRFGRRMEATCDTAETAAVLQEAAMEVGHSVDEDLMVTVSGGADVRHVMAPITGTHLLPATQLSEGIDSSYLYLSTDTPTDTLSGLQTVPAGFYTIRAIVDNPSIGTNEGIVQLVDSQSAVEAELSGEVEIFSLETPLPTAARTTVGLMFQPKLRGIIDIAWGNWWWS